MIASLAWGQSEKSTTLTVPDVVAATADILPPPPGTPLSLQGTDPRLLRELAALSARKLQSNVESERSDGVRLSYAIAALGYRPLRERLLALYVSSRTAREGLPAGEAVRYGLDYVLLDARSDQGLRDLGAYLAKRGETPVFIGHLLEALQDDWRLQARADRLLDTLVHVPESCGAIRRAIRKSSISSNCIENLPADIQAYVRRAGFLGREDAARRRAITIVKTAVSNGVVSGDGLSIAPGN